MKSKTISFLSIVFLNPVFGFLNLERVKSMKNIFFGIAIFFFAQIGLNAQTKNDSLIKNTQGPGSYEILNNNNSPIVIPFVMHNGKPLMDVEINGIASKLMIDNGILWDQVWLLGSPLVEKLALKPLESSTIGGTGEGEPTEAYLSSNLTLKFKDIIFYEQPVLVSPPSAGFAKSFPGTDGQLCNTFFKHFIVEFDFIKLEIRLHNPKEFKYNYDGSALNMKPNESGTYAIPFSFTLHNGTTYNDFIDIDLGGIYPIKIALNNKFNIQVPADAQPAFSYGIQGKTTEFKGTIASMKIGKYEFNNPPAIFGDEKTSRVHPDNLGVVGLPLFMKFNIIFDYFNNKMYIESNENFSKPF